MTAIAEGARVALIDRSGLPSWLARWSVVVVEKIGVAFIRVRPPGDIQPDHAFWLHPARLACLPTAAPPRSGASAPPAPSQIPPPPAGEGGPKGRVGGPVSESEVAQIVSDLARRGFVTLTPEGSVDGLTPLGQAVLESHGRDADASFAAEPRTAQKSQVWQ